MISAYIPCFNNSKTIGATIESIRSQTVPVDELFVVDDGSTDDSRAVIESLGVDIICHEQNLGRGAARAAAMTNASGELVLSCDATNVLPPDFLQNALPWFSDPSVAAVYGSWEQSEAGNAVERWRGRHLFKVQLKDEIKHHAPLATNGLVVRAKAISDVGNYDSSLRHTEDGELGVRLLLKGFDVVRDPRLKIICVAKNTLIEVLERYWRWYAGIDEVVSGKLYLKQIVYSIKVMALQDLRKNDPLAAIISLLSPHYQFWRSFIRKQGSFTQFKSTLESGEGRAK